ncbi:MAG: hypothetical protein ACTSP0_03380 [Alphaproteobacteria bacterium]
MASKSSDHTRLNSVRDSDRACADKDDTHTDEGSEPEYSPPDPSLPEEISGSAEDEELIGMLEQLSKTIDTAHDVIAEQQAISSKVILSEQASASEEPISEADIPLPAPDASTGRRVFVPVLATAFGVFFSIAALAAMWLFWNSPETPDNIDLSKNQDRIATTTVTRTHKADVISRSPASIPPKIAPLQSPAPSVPEPVKILEPAIKPVSPVKTAAPIEPVIEAAKDTPEPPAKTVALVEPETEVSNDTPGSAPVAVEKAPAPPAIGKDEETQLMERGQELISTGDIASARLAFEYAAHRGSTTAMFALAQTYDIEVLASWNVVGIEPDVKIALEWYGRAAQNGHDPADARAFELEKLTKRRP